MHVVCGDFSRSRLVWCYGRVQCCQSPLKSQKVLLGLSNIVLEPAQLLAGFLCCRLHFCCVYRCLLTLLSVGVPLFGPLAGLSLQCTRLGGAQDCVSSADGIHDPVLAGMVAEMG